MLRRSAPAPAVRPVRSCSAARRHGRRRRSARASTRRPPASASPTSRGPRAQRTHAATIRSCVDSFVRDSPAATACRIGHGHRRVVRPLPRRPGRPTAARQRRRPHAAPRIAPAARSSVVLLIGAPPCGDSGVSRPAAAAGRADPRPGGARQDVGMRAVQYEQYGGPEVLEIAEVEEPHAGPGRIRIAVHAAGRERRGLEDPRGRVRRREAARDARDRRARRGRDRRRGRRRRDRRRGRRPRVRCRERHVRGARRAHRLGEAAAPRVVRGGRGGAGPGGHLGADARRGRCEGGRHPRDLRCGGRRRHRAHPARPRAGAHRDRHGERREPGVRRGARRHRRRPTTTAGCSACGTSRWRRWTSRRTSPAPGSSPS